MIRNSVDELVLSGMPTQGALRRFGEFMIGVAGCRNGWVAVVAADGAIMNTIALGRADELVDRHSDQRRLVDMLPAGVAGFAAMAPCHPLAATVLGESPAGQAHSFIGRAPWSAVCDVLIVAGWREVGLAAAEQPLLARAAEGSLQTLARGLGSAGDAIVGGLPGPGALQAVASPSFRVDERLRILDMNDAARALLVRSGPVYAESGRLTCRMPDANERLRAAARRVIRGGGREDAEPAVLPLHGAPAAARFAVVAPMAACADGGSALIVMPVINGDEGARRLGQIYSLTRAEERVVALILVGEAPIEISALLGLTEATVRTYLKRIMLKLGINRRSEFFLLYILTASPFRARALALA